MPQPDTPKLWLPEYETPVYVDLSDEDPERIVVQRRIPLSLQTINTKGTGYGSGRSTTD